MRILAAILACSALASGETLPLSLKRAVELAIAPDGSARVQIAQELIKQSESRALQTRSALLPNVDGGISYSSRTSNLKSFGLDFSAIPSGLGFKIPTVVGPYDVFDARISGQQSLFDFSSIRRLQSARVAVQATKAEAQGTQNQVADQVARAYVAALRAEATLDTAKSNIELSEALVKLANSQKAAGTGTGIEITRAQVQLANDRQRLTVAQNDRDRAHLQLLRVIGLKLDGDIQLTDQLSYKPVGDISAPTALKAALDARPELKAQQDRELSTRIGYSATKWERLPSVAFFGDYGSNGSALNNSIPTHAYGLSVKVPVFDGGRRDARREEAASQVRTEQLRTRDLRDQIELDLRLAIDALRSADAQVAVSQEGVELAGRELEQARRRYEAGVTNSIEVIDAQTRLQRARDNRISALYAHNVARIDLNTAMGTLRELANNF